MGPYAGVNYSTYNLTSPYVHSRVDSNTYTMDIGQPYARVDFFPPVRDFGFVPSLTPDCGNSGSRIKLSIVIKFIINEMKLHCNLLYKKSKTPI